MFSNVLIRTEFKVNGIDSNNKEDVTLKLEILLKLIQIVDNISYLNRIHNMSEDPHISLHGFNEIHPQQEPRKSPFCYLFIHSDLFKGSRRKILKLYHFTFTPFTEA